MSHPLIAPDERTADDETPLPCGLSLGRDIADGHCL
jgi:hypothetical protein